MTDKTPAMTELPGPELGYIETDKSRQPAFSARQMREALQSAQPAAAVSDEAARLAEQLSNIANGVRICGVHDRHFVSNRLHEIARAILALRPQALAGEREAFEAWWPTVGQTIGKVAAWEAWQARASLPAPQQATPDSACKVCQGTGDAPLVTKGESLCKACYGTGETLAQATPPKVVIMSDSAEGPAGHVYVEGRNLTPEEIAQVTGYTIPTPDDSFVVISYQVNDIEFSAETRRVDENTVDIRRVVAFADERATPEPVGEPFGYFRALPFEWEQCGEHDEGAVALYTRPAPGVPEGFALVPVEPTQEMIDALNSSVSLPNCYRAMLAAAQAKGGA